MKDDGQGGECSLERSIRKGLCSGTFRQGPEWNGRASYVDTWQRERPTAKTRGGGAGAALWV